MSLKGTRRPEWLTFDCYGTLIQWDEGLLAAVREILHDRQAADVDAARFVEVYDRHEHALEQTPPHRSFREVSGQGLRLARGMPAMRRCSVPARGKGWPICCWRITRGTRRKRC